MLNNKNNLTCFSSARYYVFTKRNNFFHNLIVFLHKFEEKKNCPLPQPFSVKNKNFKRDVYFFLLFAELVAT